MLAPARRTALIGTVCYFFVIIHNISSGDRAFCLQMNVGNLSMLCWNVRGLGDSNKCVVVKDTIKEANTFILCIQETKLSEISFVKFNNIAPPRYTNYSILSANGSRGGGTLTAWSSVYTLNSTYTITFSNTVILTNHMGFTFMITNVYGPTSNNLKNIFILKICTIVCLHDLPWILLGDFNILRDEQEMELGCA
jgi:exonuclease III